jgi:hypothetical protein
MKLKKILVTVIILCVVVASLFGLYLLVSRQTDINGSSQPPIFYTPPVKSPVLVAATALQEAEAPIPPVELLYHYNRDTTGLQKYLDENAKNWLNMSLNVHSLEVFGVAASYEKVQNFACGGNTADDLLCRYALIEYTSVYKGVVTGGVDSDFILKPQVTLKEDWTEVSPRPLPVDNKVMIEMESTAVITYTGTSCITGVEEITPSVLAEGEVPPTDRSYTFKSLDERRLWPDLGPSIFPDNINEEFLRIDAERKAKQIALNADSVSPVLDYVAADLGPNGPFMRDVQTFYSPDTAKLFRVKSFEIVINLDRGNPGLRCDGTPVIK